MNRRLLTVLGFAFVVALGATLLFYGLLANRIGSVRSAPPAEKIVVAARDLQRGMLLKEADLKTVGWAASALPKGAFKEEKDVVGRGVISEISQGSRWWIHAWPPRKPARGWRQRSRSASAPFRCG